MIRLLLRAVLLLGVTLALIELSGLVRPSTNQQHIAAN